MHSRLSTLTLLICLLFSSAVQSQLGLPKAWGSQSHTPTQSIAAAQQPASNKAQAVLPPCHQQAQAAPSSLSQHKNLPAQAKQSHSCCQDQCQCDGHCPSASPALPPCALSHGQAAVESLSWQASSLHPQQLTTALFRPPIRLI